MSAGKKTAAAAVLLLIILITLFAFEVFFIPSEIKIKEGSIKQYSFDIPAEAAIAEGTASKTIIASTDRRIPSTLTIDAQKAGTADLKLSLLGVPLKDVKVSVVPNKRLVPSGEAIGIRINTEGIMVLGIGEVIGADNGKYMPCSGKLRSGDLILSANDKYTPTKEALTEIIESSGGKVCLKIERGSEILFRDINAVKAADGKYKIGIWVRDSTQGIGTVTFYDEETGDYGALGHGIADVDTNIIMSVKNGKIMYSHIKNIIKGSGGTPGELMGAVDEKSNIGTVEKNTANGIFGKISSHFKKSALPAMSLALKDDIRPGKAQLLCDVDGNGVKAYDIEIESINRFDSRDNKNMVIKVTDKTLLSLTNGIVQGMSGSPIIQNNKLAGAVTHVFVKDPSKGYGVFIENMLEAA